MFEIRNWLTQTLPPFYDKSEGGSGFKTTRFRWMGLGSRLHNIHIVVVNKCCASWCVTCTNSLTTQLESSNIERLGMVHHHSSLAHGLMHMHMLAARCAYHRTDPQGLGSKWSQHCGPPMTVYIYADWGRRIVATLVACMAEAPR